MIIINKKNVIELLKYGDIIGQSYIFNSKNRKFWRILWQINVLLSNGKMINIPSGYKYDMASVPKIFWSLVRPYNNGLLATLIHDYLYVYKKTVKMSRKQADDEFLFWLNIINKNKFDNYFRYYMIRLLGWWVWGNYDKLISNIILKYGKKRLF